MENAVDALKIGFAVLVFTMALSLAIYMFTQARITADAVLYGSDETVYMEYDSAQLDVSGNIVGMDRVVGLETIIPTLYKYKKENYTVIFRDKDGNFMPLYETQTNIDNWSDYKNKYNLNEPEKVYAFDVDEETRRHEPWTGSTDEFKKNLDAFLSGGEYKYKTSSASGLAVEASYDYGIGFINKFKNTKFKENLGEYQYASSTSTSTAATKTKRVIIYTVIE